jgi:hypothetical protein
MLLPTLSEGRTQVEVRASVVARCRGELIARGVKSPLWMTGTLPATQITRQPSLASLKELIEAGRAGTEWSRREP